MTSPLAIAREVPASISGCELTHVERAPIDVERARRQHATLLERLAERGYAVECLPPDAAHPDSVFVEDTAIVFPELAVLTRPGATSRRGEVDAIARALEPHRALHRIEAPGTLDGGDVLTIGTDVFVGRSSRTNDAGIEQLAAIVEPHGLAVRAVDTNGCLHLKSTVCRVGPGTLLVQPSWVDPSAFDDYAILFVDDAEPFAANAIWTGDGVIQAEMFPRTRARLEAAGIAVWTVPADELAKAEGGVTCCALLVDV